MHAITARLAALVAEHGWAEAFQVALDAVARQRVTALADIKTLPDYLAYIDAMVGWAPREAGDSRLVHDKLVEFHFVLNQPPLRGLQSAITPGGSALPLTPLSQWIVDFAKAWGSFLDTPESAAHIDSFRTNPAFCWDDYMPPPSGYRSFNQFFARHVKPGRRPVASPHDDTVVVSPADAVFIGRWPVSAHATVTVKNPGITAKGLHWSIQELLADSAYGHRFAGGVFMHSALRTFDFHRWHSPVAGTVLEARTIQGQAWLDVDVLDLPATRDAPARRALHALEGTGYQFVQSRGLVVLRTPIGLVACLPVGMAQVSSVVITAEVGAVLRKGEEMGYFQFGGSDFVMVFEPHCRLMIDCPVDAHRLQGQALGRAALAPPSA